ncbi:MAG: SWIM zinc finger family protein [Candidatus Competibacteraceae bacterium]
MTAWTAERVTALAPDAASVKAGRGLARAGKWSDLGGTQRVLWGECKGSGAQPYRTQIELTAPAFKCSCPSRKFPCKHALGLFLLFTAQTELFKEQPPPAWVAEWLTRRDQTAQRKAAQSADALTTGADQRNAAAKTKRIAQREAKVAAGIAELERWLRDLVRQGLAHARNYNRRVIGMP